MTAATQTGNHARNPSAHLPQIPVYPDQDSTPAQPEQERFLRLPEVRHITGLSKTTLYAMMQNDEFPQRYCVTLKVSGWKYSEVKAWMDSRPRDGGEA